MKQIYSYLWLILGVIGFALPQQAMAQTTTEDIDLTFSIMVDDPSLRYLLNANYERVELTQGVNTFTLTYHKTTYTDGSSYGYSDNMALCVKEDKLDDYLITSCDMEINGERRPYTGFYSPTTRMSISLDDEQMDGCALYPVIAKPSDLRTATATLSVDDASKIQVRCGNNGYTPELIDGVNTIPFDPVNEANWTIGAKNYGEYLGGVTLNGESVPERGDMFYLTVKQGDVIAVNTEVDNTPVSVNFSFANELSAAAIKMVQVYNSSTWSRDEIENWQNGFEVAPRTQIIVTLDQNNYNVKSLTVNGEAQMLWSNEVSITVTENTTIAIDADKYSTFSLNLTLTDPAHVSVGVAESQWSTPTELEGLIAGQQTVEVSEKCAFMIVSKKDGYAVDRVIYVANGVEQEAEVGYKGHTVPLDGVSAVIIESHEVVREDVGILWINDVEKMQMLYLEGSDGTTYFHTYADNTGGQLPVTGDQAFYFDASADNPFTLYFSPMNYETPGYVTVNDQVIYPKYQGSTTYELNIQSGDIIKVFAGEEAPANDGYTVTINVDAADRIYYETTDYETWETTKTVFPAGETKLTFTEPVYLSFEVNEGFGIKSFTNTATGEVIEQNFGSYILNLTPANDGHVFEIITYDENDSRTATMPIWVDNASKVTICYANSYKEAQSLVDGDNVFRYNPETETAIFIHEVNYGSLYKVLVNGVEVMDDCGQYRVECSPENKVEIFANFPDVEVPVTFSFTNEGTEAALANVSVNDVFVEDFLNGITVKMGDKLAFELNGADYNVTEVTLNGEPVDYYLWTVVDEKMDFVITAEKHKTIPFTLNINDPNAVTIYKGEIWYDIKFTDLVAGKNDLEVSTASSTIVIKANSGAAINSVTQNGEAVSRSWDGNYIINIEEGDVINIDAKSAQRTAKTTVIVDDASKATWVCDMGRADESAYDDADGILQTGENIVMFDPETDNPFWMSFAGPTIAEGSVKVFINNSEESLVPDFNNYFTGIVLADGDVVYVCINGGDNPVAINNVETAATEANAIYNINGVKVQDVKNLPAGLYIKNGKKIVIK